MKSILIIDDCEEYRSIVSCMLLDADYDVWEAESVDQAFQLLKRESMDLIICDLHLPFITDERMKDFEYSYKVGVNTIKELSWVYPFKPIIAISAAPQPLFAAVGKELGTIPALSKPFSADQLLTLVEHCFELDIPEVLQ